MKKIYTSQDRLLVNHFKNVLENQNINCIIKQEYLSGAIGELPPHECWPELWVIRENQYKAASQIVAELLAAMTEAALGTQIAWQCRHCGEHMEGQFTACWRCGRNRQEEDD